MKSSKEILAKSEELINKIQRLSEKQEKLLADLSLKDEKIEALRKEKTTFRERIESLELEIASLRLGGVVNLSDENKKEVRRKLNEYIKQLDSVIEKLSGEG